jgi:hypothetical protein
MPGRGDYGREVRDTVVKSGLTGVAATVLAVTVFSPAGMGGMIGTSLASGLGLDTAATPANDPYANLPAYPAPLTTEELSDIRGQLARTAASLELTRAATDEKIERVRAIASGDGLVTFTTAPSTVVAEAPSFEPEPDALWAPTPSPIAAAVATPAAYVGGGSADSSLYHDSDLAMADLLFVRELF